MTKNTSLPVENFKPTDMINILTARVWNY